MSDLERVIYINKLLSVYRPLLSEAQQEILSDYYEANLSISEIAEERKSSRAAVEDAIKKGTKKLEEMEKELGFAAKFDEIRSKAALLKETELDDKQLSIVEDIERNL